MIEGPPEQTKVTLDLAHFSYFVAKNVYRDPTAVTQTEAEYRQLLPDRLGQFVLEGVDLGTAVDNVDAATRQKFEENNK